MITNRDLNNFILIEEPREIDDTIGGYKKIWQKKYQLWAKVESLFNKRQIGHDISVAKQRHSVDYYQFTIRYQSHLSRKMRIVWKEKVLTIIKIIDLPVQKNFCTLIAEEVI